MNGVLTGFSTIGSIIALGILLAHFRVLGVDAQQLLSKLAFYVASPALLVTVLSDTDVSVVFSTGLIATVGGVLVVAAVQVAVARLVWRRTTAETVVAAFSASYVNAANLGLPIAGYVLGDASLVAPMLLTQLLLLQPVGLAVLDVTTREGPSGWGRRILVPLTNPLLLGPVLGLALALGNVRLPTPVADPLELVGGMAIPGMLLAFGISLRLGPLPGRGESVTQVGLTVLLKMVVQPLVAFLLARYALGLSPHGVLAATVIAALPTAQNVFVTANRYGTAVVLARDAIFVSTILSVPVLIGIAALLS
ncbi:AEC family transporter [Streptomyces sp. NPDC005438]|uniref:AEC family transporter n=1 Tax=Streptomyces sp. NPDC005438 TaxID=3156880 RepID=UPI0033ACCDE9